MEETRIPTRDILILVVAIFAVIIAEMVIAHQMNTKPQETQIQNTKPLR